MGREASRQNGRREKTDLGAVDKDDKGVGRAVVGLVDTVVGQGRKEGRWGEVSLSEGAEGARDQCRRRDGHLGGGVGRHG